MSHVRACAHRRWRLGVCAVLLGLSIGLSNRAQAADNAALGGFGGLANGTLAGGDGTGEARLTLNVVDLALVLRAWDTTGTVLPDLAPVVSGDTLWFVLRVENPTASATADVRLEDLLDEARFTYLAGTLEQTTLGAGATDAALWTATWTPLTDALGAPDDLASFVDTGGSAAADRLAVGADPLQTSLPLDVGAGALRAFRFRARVR
ncbi:MAG: hypothetical protein HOP12_07555 [Candidatus Eisenbacteria bacterium]|uniref:DUF11 domain-containing protein n=1 Tax=Eiseniibacteriota bacterium TaxID=2212470 RepID=A0A849SY09_UNCEI|nr:hypothetical protein [Candidatus Eisenbacteria bacterium]